MNIVTEDRWSRRLANGVVGMEHVVIGDIVLAGARLDVHPVMVPEQIRASTHADAG